MGNPFKKVWQVFSALNYSKRTLTIIGIIAIAAIIPVTVLVSQQQQEIRQRAAAPACPTTTEVGYKCRVGVQGGCNPGEKNLSGNYSCDNGGQCCAPSTAQPPAPPITTETCGVTYNSLTSCNLCATKSTSVATNTTGFCKSAGSGRYTCCTKEMVPGGGTSGAPINQNAPTSCSGTSAVQGKDGEAPVTLTFKCDGVCTTGWLAAFNSDATDCKTKGETCCYAKTSASTTIPGAPQGGDSGNSCLKTFSDVPATSSYYPAVTTLSKCCVVQGYSNGTFNPSQNITRAQATAVAARYHFQIKKDWLYLVPSIPHFTDIKTTDPWYREIETALNKRFIQGYPDGTFKPYNEWEAGFKIDGTATNNNTKITRGDFVKQLYESLSPEQIASCSGQIGEPANKPNCTKVNTSECASKECVRKSNVAANSCSSTSGIRSCQKTLIEDPNNAGTFTTDCNAINLPVDCKTKCNTAIGETCVYNVCKIDTTIPNTTTTTTSPINCPSGTSKNPYKCSNNACSRVSSITCEADACNSADTNACRPSGGSTQLALTLGLDGIGTTGDNANPTLVSGSNKNPGHKSRTVKIQLVDSTGKALPEKTGQVEYDGVSGSATFGKFKTSVNLGTVTTGSYTVKVTSPIYLTTLVSSMMTITSGTTNNAPTARLTTGNVNDDGLSKNTLDIMDYNILLGCVRDETITNIPAAFITGCNSNANNATMSDLDDNGAVDRNDWNLWIRELGHQLGAQ